MTRSKTFDTVEERDEFLAHLKATACPYRGLYNITPGTEHGTNRPMLLWSVGSLD